MKALIERIVARPRVYDLVQAPAGANAVRRRMAAMIDTSGLRRFGPRPVVIDVGAGTGGWRALWPADAGYVGVDLDPVKLQGFHAHHPNEIAIQGDATRMPFADGTADAVACTFLCHHLADAQLERMLFECARVLKPGGIFTFADPVWAPTRLLGRLLWRYDRGSFPRTDATLREAVSRRFEVRSWERFAVFHAYALCVATVGPRTLLDSVRAVHQ